MDNEKEIVLQALVNLKAKSMFSSVSSKEVWDEVFFHIPSPINISIYRVIMILDTLAYDGKIKKVAAEPYGYGRTFYLRLRDYLKHKNNPYYDIKLA